ncbi:TIGR03085 family protein [Mycobacterium sp. ACS1612]|uniref:TIGR03085 family metal-binding protein n=1 Tax=Mycobacterium sp. ACS1612 TaxID=1834117 RepID=UPI000801FD4E|nr:TIGR03085 family metal-binding protein [Mycobacterium sp. ACS1612]OBF28165.1 TIGR03085 family protein [Mycobacterium sp. ACS1612]
MTAAQRERAALVETMRAVGPDAPTLCGDWTTRDLAAHLVVRERRLDATAGVAVPFLAGYTANVQRQVTEANGWDGLLKKVASGPPLYSPFKLLDPVANLGEMFIHHEDVRRAQTGWEPRRLEDTLAKALSRGLPLMARLSLGKAPARVALKTPDGKTVAAVGHGQDLIVTGEVPELLLFLSGRDEVRLTFSDAQAAQAVRAARRSL